MIKYLIGWFMLIISGGAIIYLRFRSPELTESEFFIEYWLELIIYIVGLVIGYALIASHD